MQKHFMSILQLKVGKWPGAFSTHTLNESESSKTNGEMRQLCVFKSQICSSYFHPIL